MSPSGGNTSMKKALVVLAVLATALATPMDARADHGSQPPVHWAKERVRLLDSVKGPWDAALVNASASWNRGLTEIQTVVDPSSSGRRMRKRCPFGKGAVRVCNARYNFPGRTIGLAEYTYFTGENHIIKARIRLDESAPAGSEFATTLHEIGHTLGLAHTDTPTSCMTPTVNPAIVNPDAHDYEKVNALHAHGDAGATDVSAADTRGAQPTDDPHLTVTRKGDLVHVVWRLEA